MIVFERLLSSQGWFDTIMIITMVNDYLIYSSIGWGLLTVL